jgi:hypothetical protein
VFTATTLADLRSRLIDQLYQRSSWVRRCLRHTRYAREYAELGLCCAGWYFEHTDDCLTPDLPRGCDDCYTPPGTEHGYPCSWYWDAPEVPADLNTAPWPDAARWPGHAIDDDQQDYTDAVWPAA